MKVSDTGRSRRRLNFHDLGYKVRRYEKHINYLPIDYDKQKEEGNIKDGEEGPIPETGSSGKATNSKRAWRK